MDTKPESIFGGWADETIGTAREAAPLLSQRNASTTFDNISSNSSRISKSFSSSRIFAPFSEDKSQIHTFHALAAFSNSNFYQRYVEHLHKVACRYLRCLL
jgi:hypothetical protein